MTPDWSTTLGLAEREKRYNLPSGLLTAVMRAESAGNPDAVSPAGAQGLFQFMPKTAESYGINPMDPEQAAEGAAKMYADLQKQYNGDTDQMLAGYNWGSGNIAKHGMENMPAETRQYIDRVKGFMQPAAPPMVTASVSQNTLAGGMFDDILPEENTLPLPIPGVTPPAVAAAPASGLFDDLPAEEPLPSPMAPAPQSSTVQGLKLGSQGVGRGFADIIGMPVDLMTGALNAGIGTVNAAFDTEVPAITKPILGSDSIADMVGSAANAVGAELIEPSEMSARDRLLYNVNRFGTGAVSGAGALAPKAATTAAGEGGRFLEPMLEAYRANPTRAATVDTAAGVGSGVGVTAAEETFPDSPIAALVGSLLGGSGGATTAALGVAGKEGVKNIARGVTDGFTFEPEIARDPKSQLPVRRKDADVAARYLQGSAENAPLAARSFKENLDYYNENAIPMPGMGSLSDDVGLIGVERMVRTADPSPFLKRDRALRERQSEEIKKIGPDIPQENLADAQKYAKQIAGGMRSTAEGKAKQARDDLTIGEMQLDAAKQNEAIAATPIAAQRGEGPKASQALDKEINEGALQPRTKQKNAAFDAVDPERKVLRDITPLADRIDSLKSQVNRLSPEQQLPDEFVQKLNKLRPSIVTKDTGRRDPATGAPITETVNEGGTGKAALGDLLDVRKYLSTAADKAQKSGNYELADNIRQFKKDINSELDNVITEGGSDVSRLAERSKKIYEEDYAPYFAEGFGRNYRDAIQKDPTGRTALPPSSTGDFFLRSSPEAAKDLSRIASVAKNPAEAEKAVSNFMASQLANHVKADGAIEPGTMRKWLDNQKANLEPFPAVKDEFERYYKDVLNSRVDKTNIQAKVRDLADNLRQADTDVTATERRINSSVLRTLLDNNPENAAAKILSDGDPVSKMRESLQIIGNDKNAKLAFKRSVADHLEHRFTGTATEHTGTEEYAVLQSKVEAFMKKPGVHEAVSELYKDTPDAMNSLSIAQRIGRDVAKKNIQSTAGSPTTELTARREGFMKPLELSLKHIQGNLQGGGTVRKIKLAMGMIPGLNNDGAIMRLIIRAQHEPDLALHLFGREAEKMPARLWAAKMNRILGYAAYGREKGDDDSDGQGADGVTRITIRPKKNE